jgi:hypothetical protein
MIDNSGVSGSALDNFAKKKVHQHYLPSFGIEPKIFALRYTSATPYHLAKRANYIEFLSNLFGICTTISLRNCVGVAAGIVS